MELEKKGNPSIYLIRKVPVFQIKTRSLLTAEQLVYDELFFTQLK